MDVFLIRLGCERLVADQAETASTVPMQDVGVRAPVILVAPPAMSFTHGLVGCAAPAGCKGWGVAGGAGIFGLLRFLSNQTSGQEGRQEENTGNELHGGQGESVFRQRVELAARAITNSEKASDGLLTLWIWGV